MHGLNGMSWGMGFGWILGVLFIVALIGIVVRLSNQNKSNGTPANKSAIDILKERYAKGEIDKEEFEEKRTKLNS